MELILDTHVALFAIAGQDRIGEHSMSALMAPENPIYVSAASVWEVAIKNMKNPSLMPVTAAEFCRHCQNAGYLDLPVRKTHVEALYDLGKTPAGHKDPFDRLLMAQALSEGMKLLTMDEKILRYGLDVTIDARL